ANRIADRKSVLSAWRVEHAPAVRAARPRAEHSVLARRRWSHVHGGHSRLVLSVYKVRRGTKHPQRPGLHRGIHVVLRPLKVLNSSKVGQRSVTSRPRFGPTLDARRD